MRAPKVIHVFVLTALTQGMGSHTGQIPRVIIDTDAAMTVNQPQFPHPTDIDDDLALLYAVHMERLGRIIVQVTIAGSPTITAVV